MAHSEVFEYVCIATSVIGRLVILDTRFAVSLLYEIIMICVFFLLSGETLRSQSSIDCHYTYTTITICYFVCFLVDCLECDFC